jgi:hypothetical protein
MLTFALRIGVIGPKNAALSGAARSGAPGHGLLRLLPVVCLEFQFRVCCSFAEAEVIDFSVTPASKL